MYSSSRRDISLALNVSSDLSFTFCPLPCPPYHTSRPSLSRGVHRSHECACIRIPAVRPLNLRLLCPLLISWNQERFASKPDIFAGDQNIFPSSRLSNECVMQGNGEERGRKGEEFSNRDVSRSVELCGLGNRDNRRHISRMDYDAGFEVIPSLCINTPSLTCLQLKNSEKI